MAAIDRAISYHKENKQAFDAIASKNATGKAVVSTPENEEAWGQWHNASGQDAVSGRDRMLLKPA